MLNLLRRERGQDLVEFALIMPVVFALLFGILEFALVLFSYNTISDAAREAARWGVIVDADGYKTEPEVKAKAEAVAASMGLSSAIATAKVDTTLMTVRVQVDYDMPLITYWVNESSFHLQAASTKRIEVQ